MLAAITLTLDDFQLSLCVPCACRGPGNNQITSILFHGAKVAMAVRFGNIPILSCTWGKRLTSIVDGNN